MSATAASRYSYSDSSGGDSHSLPTQRPPVIGEENPENSSYTTDELNRNHSSYSAIKEQGVGPWREDHSLNRRKLAHSDWTTPVSSDERRDSGTASYSPQHGGDIGAPYLRWAESFKYLLQDSDGVKLLKEFLDTEQGGSGSLDFWFACSGLKMVETSNTGRIVGLVKLIYKRYIKGDELHLKAEIKRRITDRMRRDEIDQTIFDEAQADVENRLGNDSYSLFLKSDIYLQYVQAGGESPKPHTGCSSNSSGSDGLQSHGGGGPLATVLEGEELAIEDLSSDVGALGSLALPLTPSALLATRRIRENIGSVNGRYYSNSSYPISSLPGGGAGGGMSRLSNPYHVSYAPVSAQDSELQSLSSDALTDDTMSYTDSSLDGGRGEHLGGGVYVAGGKTSLRKQMKAIKRNAESNRLTDLNQELIIPRTDRLVTVPNLAETNPTQFARLLVDQLMMVKNEQDRDEHLRLVMRSIHEDDEDQDITFSHQISFDTSHFTAPSNINNVSMNRSLFSGPPHRPDNQNHRAATTIAIDPQHNNTIVPDSSHLIRVSADVHTRPGSSSTKMIPVASAGHKSAGSFPLASMLSALTGGGVVGTGSGNDENAQSILDDHVSLIWNSAGPTPSRTPAGRRTPEVTQLSKIVPAPHRGVSSVTAAISKPTENISDVSAQLTVAKGGGATKLRSVLSEPTGARESRPIFIQPQPPPLSTSAFKKHGVMHVSGTAHQGYMVTKDSRSFAAPTMPLLQHGQISSQHIQTESQHGQTNIRQSSYSNQSSDAMPARDSRSAVVSMQAMHSKNSGQHGSTQQQMQHSHSSGSGVTALTRSHDVTLTPNVSRRNNTGDVMMTSVNGVIDADQRSHGLNALNLPEVPNERVVMWMLENDKYGGAGSKTRGSTDGSDKTLSHKKSSHKSTSSSGKKDSHNLTTRRSESLDRSKLYSVNNNVTSPFHDSLLARYAVDSSLTKQISAPAVRSVSSANASAQLPAQPVDSRAAMSRSRSIASSARDSHVVPQPSSVMPSRMVSAAKFVSSSMTSAVRDGRLDSSIPQQSDRPVDINTSQQSKKTSSSAESIVIGYYFCDEPIPYRSTLPAANGITLGQFKQLISKKGNYRYYFKTASNEFGSGVIHEEVTRDDARLPLFEGKVICKVEKIT